MAILTFNSKEDIWGISPSDPPRSEPWAAEIDTPVRVQITRKQTIRLTPIIDLLILWFYLSESPDRLQL